MNLGLSCGAGYAFGAFRCMNSFWFRFNLHKIGFWMLTPVLYNPASPYSVHPIIHLGIAEAFPET
jgi:hypothetical protein